MGTPLDKVSIKLNQNLWGLFLSLVALGASEYFKLCVLFWFALVLSVLATISYIITLIPYTRYYYVKKNKDIKSLMDNTNNTN